MSEPGTSKEAIARVFTRTSESHDTVGTPLFAHFGRLLVDQVGLRPADRVLDVAAGTGASLFPAAGRVGDAGHVIGVDFAAGMVDQLRARIAAQGVTNAEAQVADAEDLPFPDASFDAVLCGFALFFFPDAARALGEFRRVLRPNGRLAIATFSKEGSATFDRTWERISAHIAGPPPPSADHVEFDEPRQLRDALHGAGLVDVDVEESPLEVVLADVDAWWAWLWSFEFFESLERMDGETRDRFRASAAADFAALPGAPEIRMRMDVWPTTARKP